MGQDMDLGFVVWTFTLEMYFRGSNNQFYWRKTTYGIHSSEILSKLVY